VVRTGPIRVLPETLVGRIAAGEVVERPGSVVKELVENALDAGAERIEVAVEGKLAGLLRVSDDGAGIPAAELAVAVQRHATSKIAETDDLTRIDSLGFRGEGLAAIGAVSRLRLSSSTDSSGEGAEIVVEGGLIGAPIPVARAQGTTVEVRDLFFNTPARRKYLKGEPAELRYISQLLQAYALARPEVSFSLVVEGRESMRLSAAADLHERVGQILGRAKAARMIPVLVQEPGFELEGFLGAPEDSRARGSHQTFLVNGRWVMSQVLRVALRQGYGDLIPPARHPEAVLHLRLPADEVDVNVHPTKREVRLLRERELYPRMIHLLRDRVEDHFPTLKFTTSTEWTPPPAYPGGGDETQGSLRLVSAAAPAEGAGQVGDVAREATPPGILQFPRAASGEPVEVETTPETAGPALASMWQLHETYILAAIAGGLLVVDQHAAHERVLFEQAMLRFEGARTTSQELLFPETVELTHDELSLLLETHAVMEKLGFHLELFGGTTVLVHAIPAGLREWREGALLHDVMDHLDDLPTSMDVNERVARAVACQGAVKAGQKLSLAEMNALVDQLFATRLPQGDPHGRPVFLRLDLAELHRRFGRSS
jgi:DNA mismatch repair protein MutL